MAFKPWWKSGSQAAKQTGSGTGSVFNKPTTGAVGPSDALAPPRVTKSRYVPGAGWVQIDDQMAPPRSANPPPPNYPAPAAPTS